MTAIRPVFLFSLPRSGSTLLQRMLAAHSQISTAPEPWILLPYLYSIRSEGAYAEYGHRTSVRAIEGLLERLPNGREDYMQEVRNLALQLYAKAAAPGTSYFVDKTPRYNLVAHDVRALFPDADYVVLWRNPLAILASILETWLGGSWRPYHHKVDLFDGLERLLDAYASDTQDWISLRYEDLTTSPEPELRRVLHGLGLTYEPAVVTDFASVTIEGSVGDPTGVRAYQEVSSAPQAKWRSVLASPVRKRWCRRYLEWIGRDRLTLMGYNLEHLIDDLEAIPSDYGSVVADSLSTVKGVGWSLLEPQINRDKLSRLPQWRRIFSHT